MNETGFRGVPMSSGTTVMAEKPPETVVEVMYNTDATLGRIEGLVSRIEGRLFGGHALDEDEKSGETCVAFLAVEANRKSKSIETQLEHILCKLSGE